MEAGLATLLVCSGLMVLLYLGLSFNVSRLRDQQSKRPSITDDDVRKAVRAHGNAAEYIPLFIGLSLFSYLVQFSWMIPVAILATLSRLIHAAGMLRVEKTGQRHPFRLWGALGTYVALLLFGVGLLALPFLP